MRGEENAEKEAFFEGYYIFSNPSATLVLTMPTNIAIIDLGSARSKLFVGYLSEEGKVVTVTVSKAETGLLSKIQPTGEILAEEVSTFIEAIRGLLEVARAERVTSVILLATEALRKTTSQGTIVERLKNELGLEVNLLSPAVEADILYAGIQSGSGNQTAVVDIGGGSVQLAWGHGKSISIPTGTFALEKRFQTPEQLPTDEAYAAIRANVSHELSLSLAGKKIHVERLIVGSSCMRDFFDSVMTLTGVVTQAKEEYSAEEVDRLFTIIAGRPYESLGEYFPINLKFMYGADKLLINLQELLKATDCSSILPTNESLSTSLVRVASQVGDMGRVGLRASPLV